MIFVLLLLWSMGAAAALLYFVALRPLIAMVPSRPLQLLFAAVLILGMWLVTFALTLLLIKGLGGVYTSTHAGIAGAGYWVTLIPFMFNDYRKRRRSAPSRIYVDPPTFSSGAKVVYPQQENAPVPPQRERDQHGTRPFEPGGTATSVIPFFRAEPLLFLGVGIVIGVLISQYSAMRRPYSSFEECFLAESKGRQESTFHVVTKLCRRIFPAAPTN